MSMISSGIRMVLLMAGASALIYWTTHHTEVSFADGLRYIREAQQITLGDFTGGVVRAIDHPLHALSIAGTHAVIGGSGPYAWQTAAQVAAMLALILAIVPLYLLVREAFEDETTACVACILVMTNSVIAFIAVNVLSESTFLVFWIWGLWASARFLREGRFVWLPPAIGLGAVAYLTRPEGILLHLSLATTLLVLPLHRFTRIHWPRWWAAVSLLILGPMLVLGPYVALKGGIGTKPAFARVIGVLSEAPPLALERESPRPPAQTTLEAYRAATSRMLEAIKGAVALTLIPLAVIGLVVLRPTPARTRLQLFFGLMVLWSMVGLIRLHVTGGYCTARHALIPSIPLICAAAHGLTWILRSASIDAKRLHLGEGRLHPGPIVWVMTIGLIIFIQIDGPSTPFNSSFAPYRMAGSWLSERRDADGSVLDLTDWSLFFSEKRGKGPESVNQPLPQADTRWLVVREADVHNRNRIGEVTRQLVSGRQPVAQFPEQPLPGQLQVSVYDLKAPLPALVRDLPHDGVRRR